MSIGLIGLGRMGCAIAKRLMAANLSVYGFDRDKKASKRLEKFGGIPCESIEEVVKNSNKIWLMVPAGKIVDSVLDEIKNSYISRHLSEAQECSKEFRRLIIIDGGNSFFKDSIRRSKELEKESIEYLDCGTSGGLHGQDIGFSLMVGGKKEVFVECEYIFRAVAASDGYGYMGSSGSGHYVKMVHNGIEYALLQSYAEGFQVLKEGSYKNLDLEEVARVWINGSVIRSWILQLTKNIFERDQSLKNISGRIGGGQTGTWALQEADENKISVPMIEEALKIREWSQETGGNYATKLVAMLRNEFGGHLVFKDEK
jgi:6-phosphogluconate dehydrogenase